MENIHKIKDNIYITSSDEEITEGDWYIDDSNMIRKFIISDKEYWSTRQYYKKVILTTEQYLINDGVQKIDDEFLEWLIKNPQCKLIESCYNSLSKKCICPKEKPKQETMLELLQEYLKNTPKEKAINLIDKMNNQSITIQEWQRASDYAKNDLKRKALIVVDEILRVIDRDNNYQNVYAYFLEVKKEIEKL